LEAQIILEQMENELISFFASDIATCFASLNKNVLLNPVTVILVSKHPQNPMFALNFGFFFRR
jgi:hypothetical protein